LGVTAQKGGVVLVASPKWKIEMPLVPPTMLVGNTKNFGIVAVQKYGAMMASLTPTVKLFPDLVPEVSFQVKNQSVSQAPEK
jgi:hypothetical protein